MFQQNVSLLQSARDTHPRCTSTHAFSLPNTYSGLSPRKWCCLTLVSKWGQWLAISFGNGRKKHNDKKDLQEQLSGKLEVSNNNNVKLLYKHSLYLSYLFFTKMCFLNTSWPAKINCSHFPQARQPLWDFYLKMYVTDIMFHSLNRSLSKFPLLFTHVHRMLIMCHHFAHRNLACSPVSERSRGDENPCLLQSVGQGVNVDECSILACLSGIFVRVQFVAERWRVRNVTLANL